jgi:response regulator of citrate/malate metabolism
MPIDPSIALGVKPAQLESPINQMAKMYEMQNAVQSNQLNQMKMDEYKRGLAETESWKQSMSGVDASTPQGQQTIYNGLLRLGKVDEAAKFAKGIAETANLGLTGKETEGKIAKQKQDFISQAFRNISQNPSDQNVIAWGQDAVLNKHFTLEQANGIVNTLLSQPPEQRSTFLASQGASASDLKPHIQTQGLGNVSNIVSVPAFGGSPTTLSSSAIGQSPDSVASGVIQTRGQNLTDERARERIALDERRVKVAEKIGAPDYVKPLTATQQYKLDKLKTADKNNAKLFDSSIDAELKNIDKLIGTEDKPKLHAGLASATGPIASRIFTGRTDTANAEAYIKSLQSKASINSLQTIRGTAGAIGTMTEREWPRLESMKATLQETQGTDQFVQSLIDYRNELKNMKLKSKEALNTDYSTEIGASASPNIDALLQKYPD